MDTWLSSWLVTAKSRAITLGATGILVWLVPLGVRAPRFIRLISFGSSFLCLSCSIKETYRWEDEAVLEGEKRKIVRELQKSEELLKAGAIQEQMELMYFPPREMLKEAVEATPKQRLTDLEEKVLALVRSKVSSDSSVVNLRSLQRSLKGITSEQVWSVLLSLQDKGVGECIVDNNSKLFRLFTN